MMFPERWGCPEEGPAACPHSKKNDHIRRVLKNSDIVVQISGVDLFVFRRLVLQLARLVVLETMFLATPASPFMTDVWKRPHREDRISCPEGNFFAAFEIHTVISSYKTPLSSSQVQTSSGLFWRNEGNFTHLSLSLSTVFLVLPFRLQRCRQVRKAARPSMLRQFTLQIVAVLLLPHTCT